MDNPKMIIRSAAYQTMGKEEMFDVENMFEDPNYVNGHQLDYYTVLKNIKNHPPGSIVISAFGMYSESIAFFIYDLYQQGYYLKSPHKQIFRNIADQDQGTINLLFESNPDKPNSAK